MSTPIDALNKTLHKTDEWLNELASQAGYNNKEQAYTALRAVLHAIRDRLLPEQAVHFSAEFPILLKGIYFDNWDPSASPSKERSKQDFLDHIAFELRNGRFDIDPEHALQTVLTLLEQKISKGAINKAKQQLPFEIYHSCEC
jgi:uncharacterized protein (DUF2267 family)